MHLPCGGAITLSSPVDWLYQPSLDSDGHMIISGGHRINGNDRVNISGSTLVINNVQKNDSGVYICVEDIGLGPKHYVNLTVQGKLN